MDRSDFQPEKQPHPPCLHVRPRPPVADDDAPPFFVRFSPDGKTLELLTPATHERYCAGRAVGSG
jgi:hypothetical protein